jgi:hypothetical protein
MYNYEFLKLIEEKIAYKNIIFFSKTVEPELGHYSSQHIYFYCSSINIR